MSKKEVKFFVSYSSRNNEAKMKFMDMFLEIATPDKYFSYKLWEDEKLKIGENWHNQIQEAAKSCDFGLLLISPAFLSSQYVVESELIHFQGENAKKSFPIMLSKIDFARYDTKGLKDEQIYMLKNKHGTKYSFNDCKDNKKMQFAEAFYQQLHDQLKIEFGVQS